MGGKLLYTLIYVWVIFLEFGNKNWIYDFEVFVENNVTVFTWFDDSNYYVIDKIVI